MLDPGAGTLSVKATRLALEQQPLDALEVGLRANAHASGTLPAWERDGNRTFLRAVTIRAR